jgi:polysaccharide pyruvyl transferase WcaK-like protein
LIVGAYGYRNVGDEAILAGLLTKLGRRHVTVVSRNPLETARMHAVDAIGISRAPRALFRHRSVVIGGGGLFGRDMSSLGRLLPAFGLAAVSIRRRVVIEGIDLDEALSPTGRILVPALLRGARHVTVRDRRSAEIARRWGASAAVAPDLSSMMPAADRSIGRAMLQRAGIDLTRPAVGLALTGVEPALAEAVVTACCGAIDALPDVQFCFIPMSRHPYVAAHDDVQLAARMQIMRPRLRVVADLAHPAEILAVFSLLSSAVTMRYHSMLFAARADIPQVPIAYAEKNRRWLAEQGMRAELPETARVVSAIRAALRATSDATSAQPVPA